MTATLPAALDLAGLSHGARAADGWYERGWRWSGQHYGVNKRTVRDVLEKFRR